MADNTTLSAGTADGVIVAGATLTVSGDADTLVQMVGCGILSGGEGTWVYSQCVGGTGVDAAGVQRVSLATDIPLPAGTNAIGKLAVNTGVDIGDVDVTSVVPGVGATNLGKAEDAVHASGDVGVMVLGVRVDVPTAHAAAGDYAPQTISEHGCQNVDAQHWATLDDMDATTGWTVINNDTDNLTTSTNHVWKTGSLSFDKVNGAGDSSICGIQKTVSSTSLNAFMEEGGGFILGSMSVSSIADIDYIWFRAGTDSSNYNEWRVQDDELVADQWNAVRGVMRGPYASTGNGWDSGAVTWVAIGVAFDAQDDTLAEILVDGLFINSGLQTSADITSQVSTSISTPNVRINGYLGQVPTDAGNVTSGTQRIVIATDDINLAAIKTSVEIMDDWDESNRAMVNPIVGQAGIAAGTGGDGVTVPRVSLATDVPLPAGTNVIGDVGIQGRTTGGLSIFYDNDLDETAVVVKAAAGTLYAMHVINMTAAPLYLQLYDVAQGSVTVGTTTPTVQFVVPGNADSDGAGFTFPVPQGIAFATAITAAATTDSEGNGAPAANACHCNLFYK